MHAFFEFFNSLRGQAADQGCFCSNPEAPCAQRHRSFEMQSANRNRIEIPVTPMNSARSAMANFLSLSLLRTKIVFDEPNPLPAISTRFKGFNISIQHHVRRNSEAHRYNLISTICSSNRPDAQPQHTKARSSSVISPAPGFISATIRSAVVPR